MTIAIVGRGAFGSAIGSLLKTNNLSFSYVEIQAPLAQSVDVLIFATPAQALRAAALANKQWCTPTTTIINCSKGIEQSTHQLPHHVIAETIAPSSYYSLVGPSFATELQQGAPTLLNLGYLNQPPPDFIINLFKTTHCQLQPSPDLAALEFMAALKNVYAILCGYADGSGFHLNTRAKLITLALQECATYIATQQWPYHGAAQPGIIGDLLITCSSPQSRNFQFGQLLAAHSTDQALAHIKSTVEGYFTSQSIPALCQDNPSALPLARLTHRIIEGNFKRADFATAISQI